MSPACSTTFIRRSERKRRSVSSPCGTTGWRSASSSSSCSANGFSANWRICRKADGTRSVPAAVGLARLGLALFVGKLLLDTLDEELRQRHDPLRLAFGMATDLHQKLLAAVEHTLAVPAEVVSFKKDFDEDHVVED